MPQPLAQIRRELAFANRILANEGILDAFGHVSMRHPDNPGRYLLSRSLGPELVEPSDILEFTLDSEPIAPPTKRLYSERVIHGEIYKARPDVIAVCHHHAPAIMPYCIAQVDIVPVFHLGATMGQKASFWDSRNDFGDTSLLVIKPEEGRSLAKALGPNWVVLMGRHGATVVGRSLRELVFRTIYSCRNAEFQTQARMLGAVKPLTPGEVELAAGHNLGQGPVDRAWEYWVRRLQKAETRSSAPATPSSRIAPAKAAPKKRATAKRATVKRARPKARKKR
ncbi:MAG TPA: class II aldolase/adducin family protein [Xanthobacteraceae bacterium]|nr:class II aldolase/adducin family protein [Xanthobacteraceae bacterium]